MKKSSFSKVSKTDWPRVRARTDRNIKVIPEYPEAKVKHIVRGIARRGLKPAPRKRLVVTHPGQLRRSEFLEPHGLTANALAVALHVPANRITAILKGQRGITADTALRLARYFGTTPDFWLNLQKDFEPRVAKESAQAEIDSVVEPLAA